MMKKAVLFLAALLFMASFALPAHAEKNRTITILFTGDQLGQITPRRG